MPEHRQAHYLAQAIFTEDLPALPLYQRLKLVAARPDFCGLALELVNRKRAVEPGEFKLWGRVCSVSVAITCLNGDFISWYDFLS